MFTSTDFSLIERIRNGEEIALDELTRGEGGISRGIVEYGGLFNYNVARLQGRVDVPVVTTPKRPMTIAEKIFATHWVLDAAKERVGIPAVKPGDQGFVRTDIRFSHEYVTPMAAIFFEELVGRDEPVNDPSSVFFFRDHLTFLSQVMRPEHVEMGLLDVANQLEAKQRIFAGEKGIKLYGELNRLNLHGALSATGLRGDLPLEDPRGARRAGTDHHRLRFAHAARGRGRMHRVRRRHDGDFQLVDHEGRSRGGAADVPRDAPRRRSRAT